ncbi:MAG TPA: hypothetical protein VI524_08450 [Anaerolineales bacterium]|nr:hypothetical protein [Anaerolineales bacterium]
MNSQTLSGQTNQSLPLAFALVFQIALISLTVGLFSVSIPISYEQRLRICGAEPLQSNSQRPDALSGGQACPPGQLTREGQQALNQVGLSVDSFARITTALDILIAVVYTASGVVIFIRKPRDMLTVFVTSMLVTFGVATFSNGLQGLAAVHPSWRWLIQTIEMIGNCAIFAFFFVFPTGRFIPRGAVFLLAGWALFQFPRHYFPDSPFNLLNSSPLLYNALFLGGILRGVAAQIYRYRQVSEFY